MTVIRISDLNSTLQAELRLALLQAEDEQEKDEARERQRQNELYLKRLSRPPFKRKPRR